MGIRVYRRSSDGGWRRAGWVPHLIMRRVVVIGGGLAGLTAAVRLAPDTDVVVLDAQPHLGGQILTEWQDPLTVERGAEGFVFRSEAVPRLAAEVGLHDDLIGQSVVQSYGFDGDRLRVLGPGEAAAFLGFQVPRGDLGKGIRSFRQGMGSLVRALETHLHGRSDVRTDTRATSVEIQERGVRVIAGDDAFEADGVVVATQARDAARLLAPVTPRVAILATAPTLSSVAVELAFPRDAVDHPLDGTGFVVPESAQREGLRACTFTSAKFIARCPPSLALLRLFFRPEPFELSGPQALDDATWCRRAVDGLGRVLRLTGAPSGCWVSRWPAALPQFSDSYRSAVADVEAALEGKPIALAGAAFHGAGIDAAVRSGERAARRLAQPPAASVATL